MLQFLGFSDLRKSQLEQLRFCLRGSANAKREGKGGDEERLNRHGSKKWMFGGHAPRHLQDHSPTGEAHCTALVCTPRGSGEQLVNCLDPFA